MSRVTIEADWRTVTFLRNQFGATNDHWYRETAERIAQQLQAEDCRESRWTRGFCQTHDAYFENGAATCSESVR